MDEKIVVYLSGRQFGRYVWYRVVLETSPVQSEGKSSRSRKRERQKMKRNNQILSPVALFPKDDLRINGSWTVIDDDIYWAVGWTINDGGEITVSDHLLKHNTLHPDPSNWEIVSSLSIPRASPFLAAVGRKLAVVAGKDNSDHNDSNNWRNCGEIYDLDNQTWDYLLSDIKHFEPFRIHYHATTVVEEEDQKPTQVVL